eukprot:CAMPEP_0171466498 /NCGR_PEP_ID=MMETSP0945-20130129/9288_1 /TAXON_ID=109269 /ORGANISM="Vaucheria litorea, Strain CCMP2940" /LENGTH=319 /DNA_ID=CAMNT_0011994589 /DNA_START=132 /DNA_END=1088 /DNA_ORIENTATION=+
MKEIYCHLSNWHMPHVQCYVVRILWMVPIYAVESWLSLRFKDFSLYLRAFRESYEAYVIYCFLYYLIALIGDEHLLANILRNKPSELGSHPWPFKYCLKRWPMGRAFVNHCKLGTLQYVVLKNILTVLTVILEWNNLYREGDFSPKYGYLYVTTLTNFSQTWALYVLVKFYYAARQELQSFRPVGKFACVKAVVFLTWWQSLAISLLQAGGLIYDISEEWTKDDIGQGLQDWLVCIEMLVAAISHQRAFTYKDYAGQAKDGNGTSGLADAALYKAFLLSTLPRDLFSDLRSIALGRMGGGNGNRIENDQDKSNPGSVSN